MVKIPSNIKIGSSFILKSPISPSISLSKKSTFDKTPSRIQEAGRRTQKKNSSLFESSSGNCTLDLQGSEENAGNPSSTLYQESSLSLLSSTPQYNSAKKISFREVKSNLFQKFVKLQKDLTSNHHLPRKYVGTLTSDLDDSNRERFSFENDEKVVRAYAANTHEGTVNSYNEDRVSIVVNIAKPPQLGENDEWPACSFFGVYDGHGGVECAEFLQSNLHQLIIKDINFPINPIEAIRNGFREAEKLFLELAQQQKHNVNKSGSCAIISLIIGIALFMRLYLLKNF